MEIKERIVKHAGKRKLVFVDENNNPTGEADMIVKIIKDEGYVEEEGTPLTAEVFKQINWRDESLLSFVNLESEELPEQKDTTTQIVATQSGALWIIPSKESNKESYKLGNIANDSYKLGGIEAAAFALKSEVPTGTIIYQGTGNSTVGSMSQNAVTNEINNLIEANSNLQTNLSGSISSGLSSLQSIINAEITNRQNDTATKVSKSGDTITGNLNVNTLNSGVPVISISNQINTDSQTFSKITTKEINLLV